MSLHLNFGVLFPASDVHWHILEGYLFLEEFVHLTFNGVFVASLHEGGCIINACHSIKVFVLSRENTAASKIVIEQVFSVTTIGYTVVN